MKKAGRTKREIADHFGLTKEQVKDLLKRYRRRERKIAAGLSPNPVGRPRKMHCHAIKKRNRLTRLPGSKWRTSYCGIFCNPPEGGEAVCKIRCDLSSSNRISSNRYVQFFAVSRSGYYSFVSRLGKPIKDAELIERSVSSKESVLIPMDTAGCGNG